VTVDDRLAKRALTVLIGVQLVTFVTVCAVKYRFLLYDDIDLALFTQALANLLRGSLDTPLRGMSWLGDHSSFNLFLLAPLFAVFPSPLTLLVVQSAALALGAWPVYALARGELEDPGAALGCAALYLLYPALGYLNLFEFHPEALSTPALLAAFATLRAGRVGASATWSAIALLGKEDVSLVVAAMGLYALAGARGRPERARAGAWLLGLAAAALTLSFAVVKPRFASGAADYGRMYEAWGRTPREVLGALLRHPLDALGALFATPGQARDTLLKRQYWVQLLLPLGFLPLVAPEVLALALPVAFEHMLSWRTQQHTILYQYTALVIPFVVCAAVLGLRRVARGTGGKPGATSRIALAALACALVSQAMFGPLWSAGVLQAARPLQRNGPGPEDRAHAAAARLLLARVPEQGAVVAGPGLLAPLATRPVVHSLHHVVTGVYTFSQQPIPIPDHVTALIADMGASRLLPLADLGTGTRLRELIQENQLVAVEAAGDLLLYLRGPGPGLTLTAPAEPAPAMRPRVVYDGRLAFICDTLESRAATPEGALEFVTRWRRTGAIDRMYIAEWLVMDGGGGIRIRRQHPLGYLIEPPSDWPIGVDFRERVRLPLWRAVEPGEYRLALRLGSQRQGHAELAVPDDPTVTDRQGVVLLGAFQVARAPRR
jgi:uncharacterized membrane protein